MKIEKVIGGGTVEKYEEGEERKKDEDEEDGR